jgi:hypothetical protein
MKRDSKNWKNCFFNSSPWWRNLWWRNNQHLPPDVYSIAVITKSSSKVFGRFLTIISIMGRWLSYRKVNRKKVRLYARPKFPGFERGSGYSYLSINDYSQTSTIIASPLGEANNRIRRKKKYHVTFSVSLYVTLHSSGVSRSISDFFVVNIRKNMRCDQNKNNFIFYISFPVINEKLLK